MCISEWLEQIWRAKLWQVLFKRHYIYIVCYLFKIGNNKLHTKNHNFLQMFYNHFIWYSICLLKMIYLPVCQCSNSYIFFFSDVQFWYNITCYWILFFCLFVVMLLINKLAWLSGICWVLFNCDKIPYCQIS